MNKYEDKDNYGNPKVDYIEKVTQMNYEELLDETKRKIWLSAWANNNPRSDYHWHCDACYDEWKKRNDLDSYEKAWKYAANQ